MLTDCGPVIIDWLTAISGAPAADVARSRLLLEIGRPERPQNPFEKLITATGRRLFVSQYLKHYLKHCGMDPGELAAWAPIMAAARLHENIAREETMLRARIAPA